MEKRIRNIKIIVERGRAISISRRLVGWGLTALGLAIVVGVVILDRRSIGLTTVTEAWAGMLMFFSLLLTIQSILFIFSMVHAWNEDGDEETKDLYNKNETPKFSFTALLPARHEEKVIGQTIKTIANIDYPDDLKQLIVITHDDDPKTIKAASVAINSLPGKNIKLVINADRSIMNKPRQMNFGLSYATGNVIVPFDAEDQPSSEIYKIINSTMRVQKADVVQAGVQLIDYKSHWYSALNCLEYFFWFKSILPWLSTLGVVPLGGNTVFFKKDWLTRVGGWDESCLTEDGEIGLKLSAAGAKIAVVYSEEHVTQEETPPTLASFIKQRTRWNQGFLQILAQKNWQSLPGFGSKLLAVYLLLLPILVGVFQLLTPILGLIGVLTKVSVVSAMITFVPMGLMTIQIGVLVLGLWAFAAAYHKKLPILETVRMIFTIIPYNVMLTIAAGRAGYRFFTRNLTWEKTAHVNAHRLNYQELAPSV